MKTLTGIRLAATLLACSLLASCANVFGPRQVELPLHKLQAGMERRFPLNNRVLELFEIRLTRPQLALLPDTNRVALTMDASVAPPFLRQSWTGTMAMSGRLYVDAARGAVMMAEPRVDQFAIDGMDQSRQRQVTKVANVLVDQLVRDTPVYSFRPEDLRYAGVQFVPTRITAARDALLVTLEPVR
ncbi:DUF1439 domain-containing protein [Massilia sp. GCM10020059]|uniref:DUF1439 domain-containing protein n=1 Tax=Massilia agrisoli TaxID=2892444 RepID=A0ABS8IS96_9BURK|nr:DUF1439 domain-containing protein [Massilia agrisoli]MCC6070588.1 DUF1439 domain-containing protein [Massilia agrisoli]